jgi:hypothetical protein
MKLQFNIISEGITDFWTIENILHGFFNDRKEEDVAFVTMLQPNNSQDPGGYTQVFDFINTEAFKKSFQEPDSIAIIHLDTDTIGKWSEYFNQRENILELLHQLKDFGGNDHDRIESSLQIIYQIIRLVIGQDFFDAFRDRIIIAIAVNDVECWALALNAADNRKTDFDKIAGCLNTLNLQYNFKINPTKKADRNGLFFMPAIKDFLKKKNIEEVKERNQSLNIFLNQLYKIEADRLL